jgi:NADH-quinone oxidoreductase subunit N
VIASLLAQFGEWTAPVIDWHALAPELILVVGINLVLFIDLNLGEAKQVGDGHLTGFVLLAAFVPVVTLAVIGDESRRCSTVATWSTTTRSSSRPSSCSSRTWWC